jgi:hypothetical protein
MDCAHFVAIVRETPCTRVTLEDVEAGDPLLDAAAGRSPETATLGRREIPVDRSKADQHLSQRPLVSYS